ncbi:MAG: hypothetical protein ACRDOH_02200 [Streptosporangiaceae bacterium]
MRPAAEYPARHIPGVASTPVRRARDPPRRTAPGQPGGPLLPPSSDADQAVDRAAADGRTAARLADRFPERAAARLRAGNGRVVSTTPPAGPPLLTPVSPGRGARQVLQAAAGR